MKVRTVCPAKINLSLVVLPPDSSGLHPLRTTFQTIDLCDDLCVTRIEDEAARSAIEVRFDGIPIFDWPEDNTLAKTLRLVGEMFTIPSVRIEIVKRIPTESGLGGGSSNAAGLLRILGRFLAMPLTPDQRADLAAAVGWDVPFFMTGGHAEAEGYGERIRPLEDAPEAWYALAMPNVSVSSAAAYANLDQIDFERAPGSPIGHNDFERVAPCESLDLIERLRSLGADPAMLSGSGSAVFGRFASQEQARRAADVLANEGASWTAVAKNLPRTASLAVRVEA